MREINSMRAETRELLENASVSREMRETWHVWYKILSKHDLTDLYISFME